MGIERTLTPTKFTDGCILEIVTGLVRQVLSHRKAISSPAATLAWSTAAAGPDLRKSLPVDHKFKVDG